MSGSAYQPTQAKDKVAVFDSNFNQLFANARPMRASIKETAKQMKHPVENGATVTDFRIIEPISISLDMTLRVADYVGTYNEIKQAFLGNATLYVQTKTGLYSSMVIEKMPHQEDPKHFDTITVKLDLEQVIIASLSTSPLPAQFTTKKGGNKTGQAATATQEKTANSKVETSSVAHDAYHYVVGGN